MELNKRRSTIFRRAGVGLAASGVTAAIIIGELGLATGAGAYTVPKVCKVPSVVGKVLSAAEPKIVSASCTVGKVTSVTSSKVAAGDVISTQPAAGKTRPLSYAVAIVVSIGKPASTATCTVPKLGGEYVALAEATLAKAACGLGKVTTVISTTVPKGDVISSSPGAGASEAAGSLVKLTVSGGKATPPKPKPMCTVPKLAGKSVSSAKTALHKNLCGVGKVTGATSKSVPKGDVIASGPVSGTKEPAGYKVKLVVSKGKPA